MRNSTDPKERAQASTYGRQMAAAGASKSNFSGYQSATDAKKNLPAPAQRTSIADRLKSIRDMRARSQSRITAQGGKPATPAVQPKTQPAAAQPAAQPKVQPTAQPKVQPTTNPNQQSSLNNTVRSGTGGSSLGSERVAAIRARADAARERAMQNASPSARRTIQDLQNRRNATRNQAQGNLGRPMNVTTGSGQRYY